MTTETNTAPVEDDNEAKATADLEETTTETKKVPLTVPVPGRPGGPGTGADGNYDPHSTDPTVN
ncbi:hypothetical protein ACIQUM_19850 [Amycolatopsis azurea]|uniref:hypothetical protein n=1 Tax=Amycolatopsis azurea TaxID=36819 RepID=UPI0037F1A045